MSKRITFIATKKNLDPTERELYEMDLVLRSKKQTGSARLGR